MKKRVLFFLNSLPHDVTGGGMLYNQVLESYGRENVSLIGVSSPQKNSYNFNQDSKQFRLRFPKHNLFYKILKKVSIIEDVFVLINFLLIRKNVINHLKREKPASKNK